MAHSVAADRDGDRKPGDVRRVPLDMDGQRRRRAAELRPDARLVDHFIEILFELRVVRIGIVFVAMMQECPLGHDRGLVHRAADADTDDRRRAGIAVRVLDDVEYRFLHALDAVRRDEHREAGFVLRAEALRSHRDFQLVAGDELRVNDARCVVARVLAVEQRLRHDGFPEIAFRVTLADARVDGIFQKPPLDVDVLPDLDEDDGQSRVLAIGTILGSRDFGVLDDLVEHILADRRFFRFATLFQSLVNVVRQIVGCFLAKLGNGLGDFGCLDSTHNKPPLKFWSMET